MKKYRTIDCIIVLTAFALSVTTAAQPDWSDLPTIVEDALRSRRR